MEEKMDTAQEIITKMNDDRSLIEYISSTFHYTGDTKRKMSEERLMLR